MMFLFRSNGDIMESCQSLDEKVSWIHLVDPSAKEVKQVAAATGITPDFLAAALDEEERSRIESEDDQVLVIVNVPVAQPHDDSLPFDTLPLGIIVTNQVIVTVCLRGDTVIEDFFQNKVKGTNANKRTRFLLQILFRIASTYLRHLRQIDKISNQIERRLHSSMRNEELIRLLNLEKSLVYFNTSLRSNEIVLEKLLRSRFVKLDSADPEALDTSRVLVMYPEDEDLLDDVITENKQAIEMGEIYSNILSGMMDAFASIISNNLNIVMKFLASITIILSIPTIVFSFFGMNVGLPWQHLPYPWGFISVIGLSVVATYLGFRMLAKRDML
jgi:magnesium transporter